MKRDERLAAAAFGICLVCGVALAIVYWQGGHPQAEGLLLAAALFGLGVGFVLWAHRLLPPGPVEEPRHPLPSEPGEREAFEEDFERADQYGRRTLLRRALVAALGGLGVAALFPIRSLGPSPGRSLVETRWRAGRRLVTIEGEPVRADDVPLGGLVTVFPDGDAGSADGQAVLIRAPAGEIRPGPGREDWSPQGLIAYSKVCTHAGCPVGLYQAESHELLCPCHQSSFDVLDGAKPVFGPAARPLPQLPLVIDDDGVLRATGDFSEPVGPAWWTMP